MPVLGFCIPFTKIPNFVPVQRGARHVEEHRQGFPVSEQVTDGFTQSGVGFNPFLVQLMLEPGFEFRHDRPAVGLMPDQTGPRRVPSIVWP